MLPVAELRPARRITEQSAPCTGRAAAPDPFEDVRVSQPATDAAPTAAATVSILARFDSWAILYSSGSVRVGDRTGSVARTTDRIAATGSARPSTRGQQP